MHHCVLETSLFFLSCLVKTCGSCSKNAAHFSILCLLIKHCPCCILTPVLTVLLQFAKLVFAAFVSGITLMM